MPRKDKNRKAKIASASIEVIVEGLGTQLDGIAKLPSGTTLYIPYAAPGDRLNIEQTHKQGNLYRAKIIEIINRGRERVLPKCWHFGACGACTLQHISNSAVLEYKRVSLKKILNQSGLRNLNLRETVNIPPGTRRRVELAFKAGKRPLLGFHKAQSRKIIDIDMCLVVIPEILNLLPDLRSLLNTTKISRLINDIRITATAVGLDLLLILKESLEPEPSVGPSIANFAAKHNLARISWSDKFGSEPIIQNHQPSIDFGSVNVPLPIEYFLQPTAIGEEIIVHIIKAETQGSKIVADLFSGLGSLSFPLANNKQVHSFELDQSMVSAMRRASGGVRMTAVQRDLYRAPLTQNELKLFDAVVFDPPKIGAREQAGYLAQSNIKKIIAVSCNPHTFARDLLILTKGGYKIEYVIPIDQFTWSSRLEAVAVLTK